MDYYKFNLFLVGAFLLGNLILGLWAGRKTKDLTDYAIGSKSYGTGAIVLTYLATAFGGGFLFSDSKQFFNDGLGLLIACLSIPIAQLFVAFFISKKMDRFKSCITVGDVVEELYGRESKIFTGVVSGVFNFIDTAIQIKALSIICECFLNINGQLGILISGLIITIYTAFGGIRAVTATDILQFLMMICALFILSTLAVSKVGGAEIMFSKLPADRFTFFQNKDFPLFISLFIINGIFSVVTVQPMRMQRILMAKDPAQIKNVFILCAAGSAVLFCMHAFMSYAGIVLYPENAGNFIFHIYNDLVSDSFKGVVIIGLIAIIFSSGDSVLHVSGLSISHDIISPLSKDRKVKLSTVKIITFVAGILSTLCAYNSVLLLHYIKAGMLTPIAAPIILGILGLKSDKRCFWIPAIITLASFLAFQFGFAGEILKNFSMLAAATINFTTFLAIHIYINKGIAIFKSKAEKDEEIFIPKDQVLKSEKLQIWPYLKEKFTSIYSYPEKFTIICEKKVEKYGASYVLFGCFYCAAILMPYFVWGEIPAISADTVLYFKVIGLVLSGLLICSDSWPEVTKRYLPAFWYIALAYCLPFLSSIMLMLTNGAPEYTMNIALSIMFLIILVDWVSAISIGLIGVVVAIFVYKHFIQAPANPMSFNFHTVYSLTYQIIFGTVIGLLFARRRQVRVTEKINEGNEIIKNMENGKIFLLKTYDELEKKFLKIDPREKNNSKAICMEEAFGGENLALIDKISKLNTAIQNPEALSNEQWVQVIGVDVDDAVFKTNQYMKLSVLNTDLKRVSKVICVFCEDECGDNLQTVLRTEIKPFTLNYDSLALHRIIFKAIKDIKIHLGIEGEDPEKAIIRVDISDVKLRYSIPRISTYSTTLPAIRFIVYTADSVDTSKTIYDKEIGDPLNAPPSMAGNEIKAIDSLIIAQYIFADTQKSGKNIAKTFVLPQDIYAIRPQGFDYNYKTDPVEKYVLKRFPAAVEIEQNFLNEIKNLSSEINCSNLQKTLEFLRTYYYDSEKVHTPETPFYLHPVQATRIFLRMVDLNKKFQEPDYDKEEVQEILIITSLLQHIIDKTAINDVCIESIFGREVSPSVLAFLDTLSEIALSKLPQENRLEKLRQYNSMHLCIKLASKMHYLYNIDTLRDEAGRKQFAKETLDLFVPIAQYLEFSTIASDMEGACKYTIEHGKVEGFEFKSGIL